MCVTMWPRDYVCLSSLRRWSLFLLVGFTDPYNHTYSESLWWKLFKNHKRTQIQRQRQWQRQRQRQRHRQSAWKTQHMLYFWNPDDLLIPNMMIDTSTWSSCSRRSPWLPCSGHTISSTGPSVSPFRDFCNMFTCPKVLLYWMCALQRIAWWHLKHFAFLSFSVDFCPMFTSTQHGLSASTK